MSQPNAAGGPTVAQPSDGGASTEALRRVKQAEADWSARVGAARRASEDAIRAIAESMAQSVREAHAQAERSRLDAIGRAREGLDQEVAAIAAEGTRAAEQVGGDGARVVRAKKAQLLAAVLDSLETP